MIDERFRERFEDWLELVRDHHTVLRLDRHGPHHVDATRARASSATRTPGSTPTRRSSTASAPSDALYRTETFGPHRRRRRRSPTFDEAIELANGHGYGLSSAIYTTSPQQAFRFRERVSAGMVSVNNSTSGAEAHLPFGGNGKSGNGSRQSGIWVLDQFTRWQSMNWDYAGRAAEGPDGDGGHQRGPWLPPLTRSHAS